MSISRSGAKPSDLFSPQVHTHKYEESRVVALWEYKQGMKVPHALSGGVVDGAKGTFTGSGHEADNKWYAPTGRQ